MGFCVALLAFGLSGGCRHSDEADDPAFPELVDAHCQTREGCQQLLGRLAAKRDFCFQEYGTSEDRPVDCDWNDIYWWALKDHVELLDLRARKPEPCAQNDSARGRESRGLARGRQEPEPARPEWQRQQEATIHVEQIWAEIDPKKCAIEGDEAACYQLVRFIALGESPHRAEAQAALAAGQRVIDERRKQGDNRPNPR